MIYRLLERQAERFPDAVALSAPGGAALAYRRLWERVKEVNADLNRLGVGRGDRVAMVLPNGPETAVAFLAVASGATAAPLNPTYRAEEVEFYLSDLGSKTLIVAREGESPAVGVAKALGISVIELSATAGPEAGAFTLAGHPAEVESAVSGFAGPDEVALVLHTSGTTSRPKLVPLTH